MKCGGYYKGMTKNAVSSIVDCEVLNEHNLRRTDVELTVWSPAYNHAKYIAETIDNILGQKTTFEFIVVINDDASTDGTTDIIREYAAKYPDKIVAIIMKKNVYQHPRLQEIYNEIKANVLVGKYFAMCECDDYWIDDNKLQIQYEFLEKNNDCILTIHGAIMRDCTKQVDKLMRPFEEGFVSDEQIIMETSCIIPTASAVGRKDVMVVDKSFPVIAGIGDKKMWLNAMMKGKIYYIDKAMSVYRYMQEGSWTANNEKVREKKIKLYTILADFFLQMDEYSQGRYCKLMIKKAYKYCYYNIYSCENMTLDEFVKSFEGIKRENNVARLIEEQVRIFKYIKEDMYIDADLEEFCRINKGNIYIYGAGYFGKKMLGRLRRNSISPKAFVISDGTNNENDSIDIPILHLSELADKEAALIIAVADKYEKEIRESLADKGIERYITPYWLGMKYN